MTNEMTNRAFLEIMRQARRDVSQWPEWMRSDEFRAELGRINRLNAEPHENSDVSCSRSEPAIGIISLLMWLAGWP